MAHQEVVHQQITKKAFESSDGAKNFLSSTLRASYSPFDLLPSLRTRSNDYPSDKSDSPRDWVAWGAYMEDDEDPVVLGTHLLRVSDHFYAVAHTPKKLTDSTETTLLGIHILPTDLVDSFTWATTPMLPGPRWDNIRAGPNQHTWYQARYSLYHALIGPSKVGREADLALSLYALGHVLHLNQDLSQPDHTRNDEHTPLLLKGHYWIEDYGKDIYLAKAKTSKEEMDKRFPTMPHGWKYWRDGGFQKLADFWDRHKYVGQASALDKDARGEAGEKLGLAEYSNGNFLGEDATYGEYFNQGEREYTLHYFPYPSLLSSTTFPVVKQRVAPWASPTFLRNGDQIHRVPISKAKDGAQILFHSFLTHSGMFLPSPPGGSLGWRVSSTINDPLVLEGYHLSLIPKAIEYSAGILDYFFRGNFEVTATGTGGQHQLHIINRSGQTIMGGTFEAIQEASNGDRTQLSLTSSWGPSSTLNDGDAIDATFSDAVAANTKCILVYKGTIGWDGSKATDDVDKDIAIATKSFLVDPQLQCQVAGTIPSPEEFVHDNQTAAIATEGVVMPKAGGVVTVDVDDASGSQIGDIVVVNGGGDCTVAGYTTFPDDETLTLKANDLISQVPGAFLPANREIPQRQPSLATKAAYVPTVNRIFLNVAYDNILVINPDTLAIESNFHISNFFADLGQALMYAADVDRLYWLSSRGKAYAISPQSHKIVATIPWKVVNDDDTGYWVNEAFYDPVNHRVGFSYMTVDISGPIGLLMINTANNTIAADLVNAASVGVAYSPADDRIYAAFTEVTFSSATTHINIYSANDFNPVTTLTAASVPFGGENSQLLYAPASGELYCAHSGGSFYIDPAGTTPTATTSEKTVPPIGQDVVLDINSTTGMTIGNAIRINGVLWRIVDLPGGTQVKVRNLSATDSTIPLNSSVLSGGPQLFQIPALDFADSFVYAAGAKRIVVPTSTGTYVFNPVTKAIDCTIPTISQSYFWYGCEGPNGMLFLPYEKDTWGVQVVH